MVQGLRISGEHGVDTHLEMRPNTNPEIAQARIVLREARIGTVPQ